jgi:HlyD family secretion protein
MSAPGSILSRPHSRRVSVVLAVVVIVATIAIFFTARPQSEAPTISVTRGDIHATVTANAHVRAVRSARLSFPYSGQIAQVRVQEGDTVKAGDVLAELKSDDFDRRTKQAELALAARQLDLTRAEAAPRSQDLEIAQANLKKAAVVLAAAEDNYKKTPNAGNAGAREIAQADYDIARASFDRLTRGPSDQDLQALQNAVESARLELEAAHIARDQTQLRAPYDAIVTEVNVQAGELVGGFVAVVSVADLSNLELRAEIDEIDVGAVAADQAVEIQFDAFPGKTVKGRVAQVFPAASTARGATNYEARISFDADLIGVRPGMGATVKIATVEKKNVLLVPSRAIKNAGTQKIIGVRIDGILRNVVIQTGLSDGNQTEVISGLNEGTLVVLE